jgi:hypothetical protein
MSNMNVGMSPNQLKQQEMVLSEKHQSTIQGIKQLQDMEKYMFQNLNSELTSENPSVEEQKEIINRINELSLMRIDLFNRLKESYSVVSDELNQDRNALADQITMVNVVEHELNQLKKNIDSIKQDKNNKLRLVEIGEYQFKRYEAHSNIMQVIALAATVVFIASFLLQRGMIPSYITTIVIIGTIAFTIIYLVMKLPDIIARNKFDYDKYDFLFDKKQHNPNYQTVLQHDKLFFEKLKGEAEDGYKGVRQKFNDTVSGLQKVSSSIASSASSAVSSATTTSMDEISSLTKGSLGKPDDKVSISTQLPSSTSIPQPTSSQHSGIENFQVIGNCISY